MLYRGIIRRCSGSERELVRLEGAWRRAEALRKARAGQSESARVRVASLSRCTVRLVYEPTHSVRQRGLDDRGCCAKGCAGTNTSRRDLSSDGPVCTRKFALSLSLSLFHLARQLNWFKWFVFDLATTADALPSL